MHAADCDLVDQGHESVLFPAVDQQGLPGSSQDLREVPEQGGTGEPGAEDDHARTAPNVHFTGHTRECPSGTSLLPSLHPSSTGSISFGEPLSARRFTKRAPERRLHGSPADGVPAVYGVSGKWGK